MEHSSSLPLTGELPKSPDEIRAMLEDELPSTCFQKKQGHEVPRKQCQGSCNSSTKRKTGLCSLVNKIASRFVHPRCSYLFSPAKAEKEGQEPVFPPWSLQSALSSLCCLKKRGAGCGCSQASCPWRGETPVCHAQQRVPHC